MKGKETGSHGTFFILNDRAQHPAFHPAPTKKYSTSRKTDVGKKCKSVVA